MGSINMNPLTARRFDNQPRMSRRGFHLLCAACLAASAASRLGFASDDQHRQLIRDPDFQRGFQLLRPEPGKKVPCGIVQGPDSKPVVWNLAQWSSRFPFDDATPVIQTADGARQLENPARRVQFGGQSGILSLAGFFIVGGVLLTRVRPAAS